MKPALSRARPAFWAMLLLALLALLGSAGMKWLAMVVRQDADPDLQVAVYRYPADALPDCEQLLGRTSLPAEAGDGGALWARLPPAPLTEIAAGTCRTTARLAM